MSDKTFDRQLESYLWAKGLISITERVFSTSLDATGKLEVLTTRGLNLTLKIEANEKSGRS